MPLSFPPLSLFLLLLLSLLSPVQAEEEEPISVESPMIAVEEGHTAEVRCTTKEDKTPRWFLGSNATGQSPIPEDSSLRIFADAQTGTLTVREARLNDSGTFLCQTVSAEHSATVELKVYDMPSYRTEGIVVGVVGGVLLLVLLGGLFMQYVRKRRLAKRRKAKLQQQMLVED